MAETEVVQRWVSTGRGGAGNFPYTSKALAKRAVTFSNPQGREVDYRRQTVTRSGRGGVGNRRPTPEDSAKRQASQDFERDQEIIKERAANGQGISTNGNFILKSGRGGAGNIVSRIGTQQLPTTAAEGATLERVHSYGRSGSSSRSVNAIPMADMNKVEEEGRFQAKNGPPPVVSSRRSSGFARFRRYASACFNALTPAENRIATMPPTTRSSIESSMRSSVMGAGGRGGAGSTAHKTNSTSPSSSKAAAISPMPVPAAPTPAHVGDEPSNPGYAASYGHAHDPEMPVASGPSPSGPSRSEENLAHIAFERMLAEL